MLSPRRVKLLDKVDDIASIPVGTAKVIPEVLVGVDRERGCPFLSERGEKEEVATFSDSLAISIGSHPLENADRLDFVYSHILYYYTLAPMCACMRVRAYVYIYTF